ncbi:hypothetical protein MIMGU_mgv1a026961mg [Erythranthe guttata]|uniref:Protein EARLY FLOWERING 4 domain-containing protein n=1 Tax=Erythranthe guttata TaxID=4155 RepID=A0A022S1D3_ERYGU|nr:PREDICTED: protein EARLY FLOWERING 4-like [Erythranthe guttata]EYU45718.1 hypothetical protein MIMGU_mgv1a026961mg [Erythranthe guttata]|eukprot:XP_012839354.1 PREDICTED: protein EARLY FLOWERING 4-like [Erythranthe guttata]
MESSSQISDGTAVNPSEIHGGEEEEEEEETESICDSEAWEILSKSFAEVQSLLDRNRRLIRQVNDNHRSKIPHNLAVNVKLIREINSNISKLAALYSNLSANFSTVVRRRLSAGK